MSRLKVLSTFSGVGGLDQVIVSSKNFQLVGLCEINKHCQAVLRYHHPKVPIDFDITTYEGCQHDLLLGGFPCTDISTQGNMEGLRKGKKSSLFFSLVRLLRKHKPKYFLFENVSALLSKRNEKDWAYAKNQLIKSGYEVLVREIDSSKFGTSQQRKRVLILGIRQDAYCLQGDYLNDRIRFHEGKTYENRLGKIKIIAWSKSTRAEHLDFRIREDGLVNTLTTGSGCTGFSTGNLVETDSGYRHLTPEECEALMTWPKDLTKYGKTEQGVDYYIPDSARYRMCGNGVPSNIVRPFRDAIVANENLYRRTRICSD